MGKISKIKIIIIKEYIELYIYKFICTFVNMKEQETIKICGKCTEPVIMIPPGLDYCHECGIVEGCTETVKTE